MKDVFPINSTARIFYDKDGNQCSLSQLIRRDPDWARNRILSLETALSDLLNDVINFGDKNLTELFQVNATKLLGFTGKLRDKK